MHILHIDLGREMRGGQHQVLLLLKTLREAGHSFKLMARKNSPLVAAAIQQKFNVVPASLRELRSMSCEFDIVHAHDAKSHTWAALLCQRPFVVSRRVAFPVMPSLTSRWKYGRAARFLAVSKFVAGKLVEAGIELSRIDVVYDAAESTGVTTWSPAGPIVALASADSQKGRDLVEAAAQCASIPVTFSNNITRDFSNASAFVYISRSEGFGSAALVAMSMGVPVIASRIEGMLELFEDGISGLFVDNNPTAIAAAIHCLHTNPDFASSISVNAQNRAKKLFSPSTLLLSTLASYRRALAI